MMPIPMTHPNPVMTTNPTPNPWVVRPRPNPTARMRLFCLPYAGGGTSAYASWAGLLPADLELGIVLLPGRERRYREQPYTNLSRLTRDLADALTPEMDRPYALFGHSVGALIAFELLRELRRRAAPPPRHLFVSGRRAPHLPDPNPPLYALDDSRFIAELQRQYNGIPAAILEDQELRQLFLPVMRADITLADTHQHAAETPFDVRLTALGGSNDPRATRQELEAWQQHTHGHFTCTLFPGGHFYLQAERAALIHTIAVGMGLSGKGVGATP